MTIEISYNLNLRKKLSKTELLMFHIIKVNICKNISITNKCLLRSCRSKRHHKHATEAKVIVRRPPKDNIKLRQLNAEIAVINIIINNELLEEEKQLIIYSQ